MIQDRFNHQTNKYEIARFAVKNGYHIPGAFSKLFFNATSTEDISEVVTYANLRFGNEDNVYLKNGFNFESVSKPGYMYAKQSGRNKFQYVSRSQAIKTNLHKIVENFDPKLSQYENMTNAGWYRIWDCGNAKYTWIKS